MKVKQALVRGLRSIAGIPGISRLVAGYRGTPLIVGYHRVLPEDIWRQYPLAHPDIAVTRERFREHMRFFAAHCTPISPDMLLERDLPPDAVLVSFDDFYADVEEYALPVLEEYGIPAVVYTATSFPGKSALLWWFGLDAALRATNLLRLDIRGQAYSRTLTDDASRRRCYLELAQALHFLDADAQREVLAAIGPEATRQPENVLPDWDGVRRLAAHPLITIGAHGCTHAALSTLSEEQALDELRNSRQALDELLGRETRHFAYPFGGPDDAGEREYSLVARAGFASAVTTVPGVNQPGTSRLALHRQVLLQAHDTAALRSLHAGWDGFLRRVRGR